MRSEEGWRHGDWNGEMETWRHGGTVQGYLIIGEECVYHDIIDVHHLKSKTLHYELLYDIRYHDISNFANSLMRFE